MNQWSKSFAVANGIRIHYWRTGGTGPPLVLCHGITDNGLCWTRTAQVLQEHYDVIMPDARGHGLTDKPSSGYTNEEQADDLAALIEALALGAPRMIGHSMGARVTATLAYRRPELVNRLVLEDPAWRDWSADEQAVRAKQARGWRERRAALGRQSSDEIIAEGRRLNPSWAGIEFGPWAEAKQQAGPDIFQSVADANKHWRRTALGLTVPTLLVTGEPKLGASVTPEIAQMVAEANPNIQVRRIPDVGHNIRREAFSEYLQAVLAFLA